MEVFIMKSDFTNMTISELRSYVLQHRSDRAAFYALMDRLNANPPTTIYPCPNTPKNLEVMKKAIRDRLDK
jgi:mannitol-1-phosphate/altronate dehydrogenase